LLPRSFWGRWLLVQLLAGLLGILVNGILYLLIYRFVRLPAAGWLVLGAVVGLSMLVAVYFALADWIIDGD